MGGTQSSVSHYEALSSTSMSASMQTIQSCTTAASQSQIIQLVAAGNITVGDITQVQGVSIDTQCLFSADKTNTMASDISNAIVNNLEASGSGMTSVVANTRTEAVTKIKNELVVAINMDSVQNSVASTMQNQTVSINSGGTIIAGNISQTQTASLIAKTIMKSTSVNSIIQDIANKADNKLKSEQKSALAGILKYVLLILLVLVVAYVIFSISKCGKGGIMSLNPVQKIICNIFGKKGPAPGTVTEQKQEPVAAPAPVSELPPQNGPNVNESVKATYV